MNKLRTVTELECIKKLRAACWRLEAYAEGKGDDRLKIYALNLRCAIDETEEELLEIKNEKSCSNCKYGHLHSDEEPCSKCRRPGDEKNLLWNWKQKEE